MAGLLKFRVARTACSACRHCQLNDRHARRDATDHELQKPDIFFRCGQSANARFQGRPGACKLIEAAVSSGDRRS